MSASTKKTNAMFLSVMNFLLIIALMVVSMQYQYALLVDYVGAFFAIVILIATSPVDLIASIVVANLVCWCVYPAEFKYYKDISLKMFSGKWWR